MDIIKELLITHQAGLEKLYNIQGQANGIVSEVKAVGNEQQLCLYCYDSFSKAEDKFIIIGVVDLSTGMLLDRGTEEYKDVVDAIKTMHEINN